MSSKRIKRILLISMALILLIVWGVMYADINRRYPQAERIDCMPGDEVSMGDSVYTPLNIAVYDNNTIDNIKSIMSESLEQSVHVYVGGYDEYKVILAKTRIQYNGKGSINVNKGYSGVFNCYASDIGWSNGSIILSEKSTLKQGESTEVYLLSIILPSMLYGSLWNEYDLHNCTSILSWYPKHIELHYDRVD